MTLNVNDEMMRRFHVVPILGVVLHDETSQWMIQAPTGFSMDEDEDEDQIEKDDEEDGLPEASITEPGDAVQQSHTVAGFITPYMGRSLELSGAGHPIRGVDSNEDHLPSMPALGSLTTAADVPITMEQLLDLVKGVRKLSRCGITHGDICYWNIVLEEPEPKSMSTVPRLLLIDMGDTAPDYENDAVALAGVLLWCLEHSSGLREDTASRKKLIIASALLNEVDFDRAIGILSPASVSEDDYKAEASCSPDVQQTKRRRL
ncbi:hypothetical protein LA080_009970 [Diaporthe eres]|uniref:Non-specific serine/threonine protein kinase n=1 Tax=Diaporthe vaccinii TaxID=105482 RepID=A0ABR4DSY1_9PEZI|nr:hypothetical protein LA080_009970 [Diaporthe eres]